HSHRKQYLRRATFAAAEAKKSRKDASCRGTHLGRCQFVITILRSSRLSRAASAAAQDHTMTPSLVFCCLALLAPSAAHSQVPQTLSIPPDSPRWAMEGEARAAEYLGRKCIFLDGGDATLNDFELRDGVIEVDVATPAQRGFFGIQFRISADDRNGEW